MAVWAAHQSGLLTTLGCWAAHHWAACQSVLLISRDACQLPVLTSLQFSLQGSDAHQSCLLASHQSGLLIKLGFLPVCAGHLSAACQTPVLAYPQCCS